METKNEFKPKQWILVRDNENSEWILAQFSHKVRGFIFVCGGLSFIYCIPYEGNESLLGTTDDYKEPWKPQDGDFITYQKKENDGTIFIYNHAMSSSTHYASYIGLFEGRENVGTQPSVFWLHKNPQIVPSTEEEKQLLLDALHKEGKDWDAEKKQVVELKWQPKDREEIYSIIFNTDGTFSPITSMWNNTKNQQSFLKKGLITKTEEECDELVMKLNKAIENIS